MNQSDPSVAHADAGSQGSSSARPENTPDSPWPSPLTAGVQQSRLVEEAARVKAGMLGSKFGETERKILDVVYLLGPGSGRETAFIPHPVRSTLAAVIGVALPNFSEPFDKLIDERIL